MAEGSTYPLRLDADLDEPLSRWLWLVKWLLALPHYLVAFVLLVGLMIAWVAAWLGILFTGKYPRALFDYNLSVLRYIWRVAYYAVDGLGTDRYPPFTLRHDSTYPARLDIDYPESLSRALVLIKVWLLALPQLVVVAIFVGTEATRNGDTVNAGFPGLITICAVIAGFILLFKGKYPPRLFDFIMGMNRWVYRVLAYVLLMTDEYPPFRLDQGPRDPGTDPEPSNLDV